MEIDLSNLPKETREQIDTIFRRDFDLKVLQAMRRQTRIAAKNYLNRPRALNDIGAKTMEIDSFIDTIWRRVYGHNYSNDDDLLKFLQRRNPEIRVRSRGTKDIFVGWMPSAGSDKSKFHKRY